MKYVIVGTGNISNTYIRALEKLPASRLIGCISRSGRSPSAAPDLPVWQDLTQIDRDYDAVIVTTPNGLHHISSVAAARAGKHILVEKPLDISLQAMDQMLEAASEAKVTLAVAYQRRTNPDNLAIKQLLDQGALGKIYTADLSCRFWRDQAYYDSADYRGGYAIDGGGVFIQQAAHNIDNYVWFFGMPQRVRSELATFAHSMEAEDHGAALLRHADGMIGTIVASTCARPGYAARLEVCSEKGTFSLIDDRIHDWRIEGIENPASRAESAPDDGARSAIVSDTSRHEAVIRDFEQAVATGGTPLVSGSDARRTTELILQIYRRE